MDACIEVDGMVGERWGNIYIYKKGYQHRQAIQLLSVIMLHDLRMTVCVCSEGSALVHIICLFKQLLSEAVILVCCNEKGFR